MRPIIALIGRPNVGKSTLFNRILGRHAALVLDRPGVTRDRHYGEAEWCGRRLLLVDTGGFWVNEKDSMLQDVRRQAEVAVEQAAVLVLVIDGRAAPTFDDIEIAEILRRSGKPAFVALNKLDHGRAEAEAGTADFYRLGLTSFYPISAEHGRGIGSLLDDIVEALPEDDTPAPAPEEEGAEPTPDARANEPPRIAILGRPNVGKSTFANRLLGEYRFVESAVAGTTRDAVDAELTFRGRRYILTDTAGIRRKSASSEPLEIESVLQALQALERSQVAAVLLDAGEPAVEQDSRLIGLCAEQAKPLILVVNKADLVPSAAARRAVESTIAERFPFLLAGTPILFASGREGKGVDQLLPLAGRLYDAAGRRIPTPEINRFLQAAEEAHPPPRAGGKPVRLYFMIQVSIRPPTFLIHVNRPEGITEAYRRFMSNRIREQWDIRVPIRLIFRKRRR